jgi:hypothetical protein
MLGEVSDVLKDRTTLIFSDLSGVGGSNNERERRNWWKSSVQQTMAMASARFPRLMAQSAPQMDAMRMR